MIKVTTFRDEFTPAFVELNREWIETYFEIEPMDLTQLRDPRGSILDRGGEIFFAVKDGQAIGTCALIPHGERQYELAKMAVSPHQRGYGIGDALMRAAIDWSRRQGATSIMLLSNTVLKPAITLYRKHGFATVSEGPHPDYQRCNIEMILKI